MRFSTLLTVIFFALIFQSCNEKHRSCPPPADISIVATKTQTAVPQEPKEGRLITGQIAFIFHGKPEAETKLSEPFVSRGRWINTPRGFPVWIPVWLEKNMELTTQALDEIDSTQPEPDSRIPTGTQGLDPLNPCRVIIADPGAFSYSFEGQTGFPFDTGLARGLWIKKAWPVLHSDGTISWEDVIIVAWRVSRYETVPLMPAYDHELRHYYTLDPQAGHTQESGQEQENPCNCHGT